MPRARLAHDLVEELNQMAGDITHTVFIELASVRLKLSHAVLSRRGAHTLPLS